VESATAGFSDLDVGPHSASPKGGAGCSFPRAASLGGAGGGSDDPADTTGSNSFQAQIDLHPFVVEAAKARPEWGELTETAEQVFVLLHEDSNRGHFTRIPAKVIAAKIGKSVRMVWYAIKQLERLGFITRREQFVAAMGKWWQDKNAYKIGWKVLDGARNLKALHWLRSALHTIRYALPHYVRQESSSSLRSSSERDQAIVRSLRSLRNSLRSFLRSLHSRIFLRRRKRGSSSSGDPPSSDLLPRRRYSTYVENQNAVPSW
jgi:DNA-binding Lrp family transcriptional regulator